MPIITFPIGPLDTNCHIVTRGKDALVVDPGGDATNGLNTIKAYLKDNGLTLRAIVLTHLHFDHVYGVAGLVAETPGIPVYAGEGDLALQDDFLGRGAVWGLPPVSPFTPQVIQAGPCTFGEIRGEIRLTPGHSEGGLSLYLPDENAVLVGDTLFYRSVGRTDLPGGNLETLRNSIHTQLFTLPTTTVAYPGHGPDTTIGAEKKANPFA